MPQFHSRRSALPTEEIDMSGERISDRIVAPVSFWGSLHTSQSNVAARREMAHTDTFSFPPKQKTGNLITSPSMSVQPMNSIETSSNTSLIPRPSTMPLTHAGTEGTAKRPLVIYAPRKAATDAKKTGELSPTGKRLFIRARSGFILTAMMGFLIISLVSLSSAGQGRDGATGLDGVIQFFLSGSDSAVSIDSLRQIAGQEQVSNPGTTNPGSNVNTGDLRQVAYDAAIQCGIPPGYFENQIQQESGFNPNALSPAGAMGIAQFMPATAAGLGLDAWDPVASLYASACHMADLNNMFNGNYAMALGGYNAGPGYVQNAIASCGDAWLSCMPLETQHYVAKIMV